MYDVGEHGNRRAATLERSAVGLAVDPSDPDRIIEVPPEGNARVLTAWGVVEEREFDDEDE